MPLEVVRRLDPLEQWPDVQRAAAVRRRAQRIVSAGGQAEQHLDGRFHGVRQSLEVIATLESKDEATLT